MIAGLDRLQPGVYAGSDGALHLDVHELLDAHGYEDTEANRETLIAAAREAASDLCGGDVAVEVHG